MDEIETIEAITRKDRSRLYELFQQLSDQLEQEMADSKNNNNRCDATTSMSIGILIAAMFRGENRQSFNTKNIFIQDREVVDLTSNQKPNKRYMASVAVENALKIAGIITSLAAPVLGLGGAAAKITEGIGNGINGIGGGLGASAAQMSQQYSNAKVTTLQQQIEADKQTAQSFKESESSHQERMRKLDSMEQAKQSMQNSAIQTMTNNA